MGNPASGWRWGSEDRARASHRPSFSSEGQFHNLSTYSGTGLFSSGALASLAPEQRRELAFLLEDPDSEMRAAALRTFANRLQTGDNFQAAVQVYQALGMEPSSGLAERWIGGFVHAATDYRMLAPMFAGSLAFQVTKTAAFRSLATTTQASFLSRGFGLRGASSLLASAVEIPTFTLASRVLRKHETNEGDSLGGELLQTSLFLGAMKLGGWAGLQASPKLGTVGSFLGFLGSRAVEIQLGLAPRDSAGSVLANTLGCFISLQAGAHLGNRLWGPWSGRLHAELQMRSTNLSASRLNLHPTWNPLPATGLRGSLLPVDSPFNKFRAPLMNENKNKDSSHDIPVLSAGSTGAPARPESNGPESLMAAPAKGTDPKMKAAIVPAYYFQGPTENSLQATEFPLARVVKLKGRTVYPNERLRLAPEIVIIAAALAAFPLPTALAIIGARYAIRALVPEFLRRLEELPESFRKALPGGVGWRSATYRGEHAFFLRAELLRNNLLPEITAHAETAGMSLAVHLARRERRSGPAVVEAWLEALFPGNLERKMEWIRWARNASGIPLLMDVARDAKADTAIRKTAIATLAELQAMDSLPVLRELLVNDDLQIAAAGALLWLDRDPELADELQASLQINPLFDFLEHSLLTGEPINSTSLEVFGEPKFRTWTESYFWARRPLSRHSDSPLTPARMLAILDQQFRNEPADWMLRPLLQEATGMRAHLYPPLNKNYETSPLRPAIYEALLEMGHGKEVFKRAEINFLTGFRDFLQAFPKNQKLDPESFYRLPLLRWARVVGKMGSPGGGAMRFLKSEARRLTAETDPDPAQLVSIAEAFLELGAPHPATSLLRPLLRNPEMHISLKAAALMDRAEPLWK